MRTVFSDIHQVAHLWAHQAQELSLIHIYSINYQTLKQIGYEYKKCKYPRH